MSEEIHRVLTLDETRGEIIRLLAGAFGEHMAYDAPSRSYLPDGDDAEGSTMISFTASDGGRSMRPLTYGEIADALAPSLPLVDARDTASCEHRINKVAP